MDSQDVQTLADLWLVASLKAHRFVPDEYWINNKSAMADVYLPNAEVYVAERNEALLGFVALIDNHIASIFVATEEQGQGIGTLLLNFVKEIRPELSLNVYQKNKSSVKFYQINNFKITAETLDAPTGEKEFRMMWNK